MATDYFNLEDEELRSQQAQSQGDGRDLTGQSGVITGNQPTGQQGPSSSGSFTNLNQYLDANKDSGLGGRLAGDVQTKIEGATQQQDVAKGQYTQAVDANKIALDENKANQILSAPVQAVNDPGLKSLSDKYLNAEYKGDKQFADASYYGKTYDQTQDALDVAKDAADPVDRKTALNKLYGAGAGRLDYSGGQKSLDNILIQQDPNSPTALTKQYADAQAAQQKFNDLSSYLGQYSGEAADTTKQTRDKYRGMLGVDESGNLLDTETGTGLVQGLTRNLDARAKGYNDNAETEFRKLQNAARGGSFTDQELAKYGLNRGEHLWNQNLSDYMYRNPGTDRSGAANKEEAANLIALQQLAGKQNSLVDESRAGSYDPSKAVTLDSNLFHQRAAAEAAQYNDYINRVVNTDAVVEEMGNPKNRAMSDSDLLNYLNTSSIFRGSSGSDAAADNTRFVGGHGGGSGKLIDKYNQFNDRSPDKYVPTYGYKGYAPGAGERVNASLNDLMALLQRVKGFGNVIK